MRAEGSQESCYKRTTLKMRLWMGLKMRIRMDRQQIRVLTCLNQPGQNPLQTGACKSSATVGPQGQASCKTIQKLWKIQNLCNIQSDSTSDVHAAFLDIKAVPHQNKGRKSETRARINQNSRIRNECCFHVDRESLKTFTGGTGHTIRAAL